MVTAPSVTTLLLILRERRALSRRHRRPRQRRGVQRHRSAGDAPGRAHGRSASPRSRRAFDVDADARRATARARAHRRRARARRGDVGNRAGDATVACSSTSPPGRRARLWPDEHYVAVMRAHPRARLGRRRLRVIAAPAEAERGETIARDGGGEFVKTPSIRDAFALVATADFVFTPDTSIAHAASAFRSRRRDLRARQGRALGAVRQRSARSVEHTDTDARDSRLERVLAAIDAVWNDARLSRAPDELRDERLDGAASGTLPCARRGDPPPRPPTAASRSLSSFPASTPESSDDASSTDGGFGRARRRRRRCGSANAACASVSQLVHRRRVANDDRAHAALVGRRRVVPLARAKRGELLLELLRARSRPPSAARPARATSGARVVERRRQRRGDRRERLEVAPRATHGARAADELDARRLANLLDRSNEHRRRSPPWSERACRRRRCGRRRRSTRCAAFPSRSDALRSPVARRRILERHRRPAALRRRSRSRAPRRRRADSRETDSASRSSVE